MKNKNKGFTLVELVVSLAIIAIVISLSTAVAVTISKVSTRREFEDTCLTEYENASSLITEFNNIYSTYQYTLSVVNANAITITDESNSYSLSFDSNTKILSAQILNYGTMEAETKTVSFQHMSNITFTRSETLVKCVYEFNGFRTYTNLISFGVNQ